MSNDITLLSDRLLNSKDLIAKNMESGWPDLPTQHKGFLLKYVESYSIKEAAGEVGLSTNTGSKILRDPLALAYLNEVQSVLAQRSVINRDFVNMQWLKLLPKVMGEEEVEIVDAKSGMAFRAKEFNANAAAKVLTELSKSTNFYADGSGGTAAVTVNINLEALGMAGKEKVVGHG